MIEINSDRIANFNKLAALVFMLSYASPALAEGGKGLGPVKETKISEKIDESFVSRGKEVFESKCSACHKWDEKYVGPGLKGVTKRREPEWIMNMILNPQEMTQKDPVAQDLLAEYLTQMTFQNVTQDDARALLEYLRKLDAGAK